MAGWNKLWTAKLENKNPKLETCLMVGVGITSWIPNMYPLSINTLKRGCEILLFSSWTTVTVLSLNSVLEMFSSRKQVAKLLLKPNPLIRCPSADSLRLTQLLFESWWQIILKPNPSCACCPQIQKPFVYTAGPAGPSELTLSPFWNSDCPITLASIRINAAPYRQHRDIHFQKL